MLSDAGTGAAALEFLHWLQTVVKMTSHLVSNIPLFLLCITEGSSGNLNPSPPVSGAEQVIAFYNTKRMNIQSG